MQFPSGAPRNAHFSVARFCKSNCKSNLLAKDPKKKCQRVSKNFGRREIWSKILRANRISLSRKLIWRYQKIDRKQSKKKRNFCKNFKTATQKGPVISSCILGGIVIGRLYQGSSVIAVLRRGVRGAAVNAIHADPVAAALVTVGVVAGVAAVAAPVAVEAAAWTTPVATASEQTLHSLARKIWGSTLRMNLRPFAFGSTAAPQNPVQQTPKRPLKPCRAKELGKYCILSILWIMQLRQLAPCAPPQVFLGSPAGTACSRWPGPSRATSRRSRRWPGRTCRCRRRSGRRGWRGCQWGTSGSSRRRRSRCCRCTARSPPGSAGGGAARLRVEKVGGGVPQQRVSRR